MKPQDLPFGERRLNRRKVCSRQIQVRDQSGAFNAYLRDLAVGGGFIEPVPAGGADVGHDLLLTIPFRLKPGSVRVKAKVAWADPLGMGVRFISPTAGA